MDQKQLNSAQRYTVRIRTVAGTFAAFGMILFLLLTGVFVWLHITDGSERSGVMALEYGVCIGLAILCAYGIYRERRPRVVVCGDELTCYPRWKRRRKVQIGDITSRKINVISTLPTRDITGGPGFYSTTCNEIIYYTGETELIRLNTRMKNINRLDGLVKQSIPSVNVMKGTLNDRPQL